MTSLKRRARVAGLWYLAFTLGPFYLLYVPSRTIVPNDPAATAARVLAHQTLFRFGMLAETAGAVVFIGLSLALYRLFEDVDRHRARQLVAFVLVSAVLVVVAAIFNASALQVFRGGDASATLDTPTRQAIGMLLIRMRGQTNGINQLFWGLWLFPFGSLVVRSRFAALDRLLASRRRRRVGRFERRMVPGPGLDRRALPLFPASFLRRAGRHALAPDRRRPRAAAASRRRRRHHLALRAAALAVRLPI